MYNLSYQILIIIVPLITTPYISRVLNSEGVGIYSYTYTIASAFALFAALGINTYGQREIAYNQEDLKHRSIVFWELFIFRVLTTIIVSTSYFIFSIVYTEYRMQLYLQSFIVISTFLDISWFYQGIENFKMIAIRNVFVKCITLICIFAFVKNRKDVNIYILINSVSVLFSNILYFFSLKKYIAKCKFKDLKPWRHIKGAIGFFIPLIAVQIYSQLDKIMLGAITSSDSEVGIYEQARKITSLCVLIVTSINTVMLPRISFLFKEKKKSEIINYYKVSLRLTFFIMIPLCLELFLLSDNFVIWFFGHGYEKVSILLKFSVPLICFMCVGNFVGMQYLAPTNQQNKMTFVYIISAIINALLNSLIIRKWESVGAIMASIFAELFSCLLQVYFLKKSIFNIKILEGIHKYIIGSLVMGVFIKLCTDFIKDINPMITVAEGILGLMIYVIVLICLKEELIINVIRKIRR